MVNLSKQELNGYIEDISKLISHEEFELLICFLSIINLNKINICH